MLSHVQVILVHKCAQHPSNTVIFLECYNIWYDSENITTESFLHLEIMSYFLQCSHNMLITCNFITMCRKLSLAVFLECYQLVTNKIASWVVPWGNVDQDGCNKCLHMSGESISKDPSWRQKDFCFRQWYIMSPDVILLSLETNRVGQGGCLSLMPCYVVGATDKSRLR